MSFKTILFGRIITTITDYPKKVKVNLKWYIIIANNGFGKKQWQPIGNGKCDLEAM